MKLQLNLTLKTEPLSGTYKGKIVLSDSSGGKNEYDLNFTIECEKSV